MRVFGRLSSTVFGLIGAILALVIDILVSLTHTIAAASGIAGDSQTHFFWGLLIVIIGGIGAAIALFFPRVSAVLQIGAAIAFFFVVSWWAIIPLIFWAIGAFLAWVDRTPARA